MGFIGKWMETTIRIQRPRLQFASRFSVSQTEGNDRNGAAIGREAQVLSLAILKSVFATLLFGIACSVVCLICEIVFPKSNNFSTRLCALFCSI